MLIKLLFLSVCLIGKISTFFKIFSTQPITRLALLITVFIMSAFILIMLDFYFLGLTYIIVYVGAIAILFLFVIMMAEAHITPNRPNIETETPLILGKTSQRDGLVTNKELNRSKIILRIPKKNGDGIGYQYLILIFLGLFFSLNFFSLDELNNQYDIWTYYTINFSSEFFTFTDIQSLGFLLYLAYPFITVILGLILWCVLVGILRISLA